MVRPRRGRCISLNEIITRLAGRYLDRVNYARANDRGIKINVNLLTGPFVSRTVSF